MPPIWFAGLLFPKFQNRPTCTIKRKHLKLKLRKRDKQEKMNEDDRFYVVECKEDDSKALKT